MVCHQEEAPDSLRKPQGWEMVVVVVVAVTVRETQERESKAEIRQGWASCGDYTSNKKHFLLETLRGQGLNCSQISFYEERMRLKAGQVWGEYPAGERPDMSYSYVSQERIHCSCLQTFWTHRRFRAHTLTHVFLCMHKLCICTILLWLLRNKSKNRSFKRVPKNEDKKKF